MSSAKKKDSPTVGEILTVVFFWTTVATLGWFVFGGGPVALIVTICSLCVFVAGLLMKPGKKITPPTATPAGAKPAKKPDSNREAYRALIAFMGLILFWVGFEVVRTWLGFELFAATPLSWWWLVAGIAALGFGLLAMLADGGYSLPIELTCNLLKIVGTVTLVAAGIVVVVSFGLMVISGNPAQDHSIEQVRAWCWRGAVTAVFAFGWQQFWAVKAKNQEAGKPHAHH